jgi:hypothetical protein
MTNKETIERNIGLSFDFLRQIVKTPSLLDDIRNGSAIEFMEKDFSKKETKENNRPYRYLKVHSVFELVAEPKAHYGKKK